MKTRMEEPISSNIATGEAEFLDGFMKFISCTCLDVASFNDSLTFAPFK